MARALLLAAGALGATCSSIKDKMDCSVMDQQGCEAKGCCWVPVNPNPDNEPWCFYAKEANNQCFVPLAAPAEPFTSAEIDSMKKLFLANVDIQGSGAVVAAPDHNTGPGGDYYFHWERDGALTMISLQTTGLATPAILQHYAGWVAKVENEADPFNIDVRTEPKYLIPNGTVFPGGWCRPQNDGPGLRATALLLHAEAGGADLSQLWRSDGSGTIQRSLEFLTSGGWQQNTCDLWEEVQSSDFFWNKITSKRALEMGAAFADKQGDANAAALYRKTAQAIAATLDGHLTSGGYLIEATNRQKDGSVIVGLNANFDDPSPTYKPCGAAVAETVKEYNTAFCTEFPLNQAAAEAKLPGVLYGRYPGDSYDGGNPWILTTAALAQLLYRIAAEKDLFLNPEVLATWEATLHTDLKTDPAKGFIAAGDAVLARIAHYVRAAGIGMRLDEQLEKHTGAVTSAKSLTWSYAEVFNALHWRSKAATRVASAVLV